MSRLFKSNTPDYRKAVNMALSVLLQDCNSFSPFNLIKTIIAKNKNITISPYWHTCLENDITRNELLQLSQNESAITFEKTQNGLRHYIICYDDYASDKQLNYIIARELGHIFLEHEFSSNVNNAENGELEADCFARNLLCPLPIREEFKIYAIPDIRNIFMVSRNLAYNVSFLRYIDIKNVDKGIYERFENKFLPELIHLKQQVRVPVSPKHLKKGAVNACGICGAILPLSRSCTCKESESHYYNVIYS